MPSDLVNPSTGQVVVQMDLCVPMGAAFDLDELKVNFSGEIAQYDATLCPDALGLDDAEFNALYANKVVIWTNDLPKACYAYFDMVPWYTRLVNAGALGIVNLQNFGQTPGVWHTRFTTKYIRAAGFVAVPPIPVVSCEVTSSDAYMALTSNQAKVFDDRSVPFNSSLNGWFEVNENPWKAGVFDNTFYQVVFQGLIPVLFFVGMALGIYFMYERVQNVVERRNKATLRTVLSVPFVALAMEVFCCFLLGLFFAVDGNWAIQDSAMSSLREVFLGQLALISMGNSVLIGLSFSDFRQSSKRLRNAAGSTFASRHRAALILSSVVLVAFEIIAGIMRAISSIIYMSLNGLAIFITAIIGVWFALEARRFANILEELSVRNQGITDGNSTLRKVVEHTRKWALASSILLGLMVIINCISNFSPLLWHPYSWSILWFFALTVRAAFSICKVVLCRLPKTQDSDYTPSAGSTSGGTRGNNTAMESTNYGGAVGRNPTLVVNPT